MSKAKYLKVVEWVEKQIEDGTFPVGTRLETENEMSKRFGISRQTVRHGIAILEQKGIIETRQGSGSYVRKGVRTQVAESYYKKNIVIVTTYVNSYIFPKTIQGMERILEQANYNVNIVFTHNQREAEKRILKKWLQDPYVAGMIIEPVKSALPNPNQCYYEQLKEKNIPVIFFNSFYEGYGIPHVSLNDTLVGEMATEYLIKQGHTKIGGIFKLEDGQGLRRYEGYINMLEKYNIPICDRYICWIDTEEQQNMDLSKEKVLKRLEGCTACVCYNDEVAHELSKLCKNAGVLIPEQLSLVSVDNSELSELNYIPLTSISHPMEILGEKTARNLLDLLENVDSKGTYEFTPQLSIKKSVKKLEH